MGSGKIRGVPDKIVESLLGNDITPSCYPDMRKS